MFQTHGKGDWLNDNHGAKSVESTYDYISHSLDIQWFYAKACYCGPRQVDFPTHRMMMTSSLPLLDRILCGKERGVSIDRIQVVSPTQPVFTIQATYEVGLVTRITRLKGLRRGSLRYLVESTTGIVLEGDLDGRWYGFKRTVLFDCYAKLPAGEAVDYKKEIAIAPLRSDVILRILDLYALNAAQTEQWWREGHPKLDGKAPREVETLAEYQRLNDLLSWLERSIHNQRGSKK